MATQTPRIPFSLHLNRFTQGLLALTVGTVVGLVILGWIATLLVPASAKALYDSVGFGVQAPDEANLAALSQSSTVFAADGQIVSELHDEENRIVIPLSEIPPLVQNAVLAAEDRKFWQHPGYDVEGIGRAAMENLRKGGVSQGGSTITQQLAKSQVGREATFQRKLAEVAFAVALERDLTKEEILERYLNQVYFGSGAYGIEAAALEYFGVKANQLSVAQAATLASQIRSPGNDARKAPEVALRRRNDVLNYLLASNQIDQGTFDEAVATPIVVQPRQIKEPIFPYISDAVKQEFFNMPQFGATRADRVRTLFNGGLNIYTSFDPAMQKMAEETVLSFFKKKAPTAVLSAVDPRTGQIRAVYGNQDYNDESDEARKFNLATQGRRQPGSSLKPWVMATALEMGYSPDMTLEGMSGAKFKTGDSWQYRGVKNYGGANHGNPTMRQALIKSTNTAFAQLVVMEGIENMLDTMRRAGYDIEAITGGIHNPSIALGGTERGVTTLEMASGYGTFANAGGHIKASFIDKITDKQGNVLYTRDDTYTQVISPANAAVMISTMRGVVNGGTGGRASVPGWPVAGKTGTSQTNVDAWFAGVTPVLATAVWVGHPEGRIPMYGMTGGAAPAAVFSSFMRKALATMPKADYPTTPHGRLKEAAAGEIEVPMVTGRTVDAATEELEALGLKVSVNAIDSNEKINTVLLQSPRAGDVVDPGAMVVLTISNGNKIKIIKPSASASPSTSPSASPSALPSAPSTAPTGPTATPTTKPTPTPTAKPSKPAASEGKPPTSAPSKPGTDGTAKPPGPTKPKPKPKPEQPAPLPTAAPTDAPIDQASPSR